MAKSSTTAASSGKTEIHKAERFLLSALRRHPQIGKSETLLETACETEHRDSFISIDEVGRGCVAGPVVVCATLWVRENISDSFANWIAGLRDSKKMSAAQREQAFERALKEQFFTIHGNHELPVPETFSTGDKMPENSPNRLQLPALQFKWTAQSLQDQLSSARCSSKKPPTSSYMMRSAHIGCADATEIDLMGIVTALNLAASRALEGIHFEKMPMALFFDGHRPLSVPQGWAHTPQIMITKGDDLLKSISASSVLAKVVRDRWMETYATHFPMYHFEEHRGYGTEKHRNALLKHGFSPLHRKSFLKNICP